MYFLLMLLSILLFSLQTVMLKKMKAPTLRVNLLQTGAFSLLIALCFWLWAVCAQLTFSAVTVFCGILFGAVFLTTIAVYARAMSCGPLSYTSFFFTSSMVIPALAGVLVWNDPFRWTQGLGIALLLAAFYLISVPGTRGSGRRGNRKWLLLSLAACVLNGGLSVIVKAQQMAMQGSEAASLMTVAYTASAGFALLYWLADILRRRDGTAAAGSELRSTAASGLTLCLLAVGTGGGNYIVSYLSARVSSALLYPTVLGGLMIAVTLYSVLVLKEAVSRRGIAGIALGLAALVAMNL